MSAPFLAHVAPTSGDMAMNALIFGYAGHSLVTPHAALKQMWWTDDRIEAKVTRRFVISKLRGEEREFLRRPLAFGGDLTDRTYLERILDSSKRLFLILAEIGASDQVFGCIDDGWTDDDLPIALEDVPNLELSYKNDDALNQRFYKTQFMFLLRTLKPGAHIKYGPQEHIPVDLDNTLPPAVTLQAWDRIHFPGTPEDVFMRRKLTAPDGVTGEDFHSQCLRDFRHAQQLPHQHIASAWASYTSAGATYVLSDFLPEHTLRTFLEHRTPMQLIRVAPERRPVLLCEWMHCLADAVAYLHHNEVAHGAIKPSNIIIDQDNKIAFADIGSLRSFQLGKKSVKNESRDYAAPEMITSKEVSSVAPSIMSQSTRFSFRSLRKLSISSSSSSASVSSGGYDSAHGSIEPSRPSSSNGPFELSVDADSLSSYIDDTWSSKSVPILKNIVFPPTRRLHSEPALSIHHSERTNTAPSSLARFLPRSTTLNQSTLRSLPAVKPEMSDIYSLGCIFLDIITFVLKGKLNEFIKFRTAKTRSSDGKIHLDTSFHADSDKVEEWMDMLDDESQQYYEAIYRGVPDLLRLVRRMLAQNATLRPSACEVRDRVGDILAITCGAEDLCCADRVWPTHTTPDSPTSPSDQISYPASGGLLTIPRPSIASN